MNKIKESVLIATPFFIFAFIGLWSFNSQHNEHMENLKAVDKKLDTLFDYYNQWVEIEGEKQAKEASHTIDKDFFFEDAFRYAYNKWGEGSYFNWRGGEYSIEFADENDVVILQSFTDESNWVLNSDDEDDNCTSNQHDECGECDGPGPLTWYEDIDNDGLGNPNSSFVSCK